MTSVSLVSAWSGDGLRLARHATPEGHSQTETVKRLDVTNYHVCPVLAGPKPDLVFSLKKEVIQPQVPLRLPCYDLVPITELAFGAALLSVRQATSGALGFHDLTGGVYKAQEHIHRGIADPRLLAIPTSCRRVSACNPNWGWVFGICSASRLRFPLSQPL